MLPTLSTRRWSWPVSGPTSMFRREVDNLFDRFLGGDFYGDRERGVTRGWQAPVSIWDDDQNIFVEVELPGVSRDDIEVVVEEGSLRIRGERKLPSEERNYWYNERDFGQFERMISLAEMVDSDKIEAHMHDGVLSIKLVKRPESRRKKILIKSE